jgi:hypothetical protein
MPTSTAGCGARVPQKLQEKVKELIVQIEQVNEAENGEYGDWDLEEMGPLSPWTAQCWNKRFRNSTSV